LVIGFTKNIKNYGSKFFKANELGKNIRNLIVGKIENKLERVVFTAQGAKIG
jgi:hypothetical protein